MDFNIIIFSLNQQFEIIERESCQVLISYHMKFWWSCQPAIYHSSIANGLYIDLDTPPCMYDDISLIQFYCNLVQSVNIYI